MRDNRKIAMASMLLVAIAIMGRCFFVSWHAAEQVKSTWQATRYWIASAGCAKEYGIPLIGCPGGHIIPFADLSPADDPGHAFFLDIYAILTKAGLELVDIARLNIIINYVGIALVVCLFLQMRMWFASAIAGILLALFSRNFVGASPHPAQIGVALFSTILPIALLGIPNSRKTRIEYFTWIGIGLVALGTACLLRQAIGAMGTIAAILAICFSAWSSRGRPAGWVSHIMIASAVVVASLLPTMILRLRDVIWGIQPAKLIESHGIWHNVFIGLGVVANPFGIEWRDSYGREVVAAYDPSVAYVSERYYEILRDKYIEIVLTHPFEVVSIYLQKLVLSLQLRLPSPFPSIPLWVLSLLLVVTLFFLGRYRASISRNYAATLWVSAFFVCMFLMQGAIINPDVQYMFPIGVWIILAAACLTDAMLNGIAKFARIKREMPAN